MAAEHSDQQRSQETISCSSSTISQLDDQHYNSSSYKSEIIEEVTDSNNIVVPSDVVSGRPPLQTSNEDIIESAKKLNPQNDDDDDDCVYVAVGKSESSMDALAWTLRNAVNPSTTTVYLIHVFPKIRHVPSPLGNLRVSQVNRDQLESFMTKESNKRRELLQKFLQPCHFSKVNVDTILIESDMVAKAISDLIPVLNIRKLVVGTSKSGLRKLRARKGSVVADQILHNAAADSGSCQLKIICEGNEVVLEQLMNEPPSPAQSEPVREETEPDGSVSCICFKNKFI